MKKMAYLLYFCKCIQTCEIVLNANLHIKNRRAIGLGRGLLSTGELLFFNETGKILSRLEE